MTKQNDYLKPRLTFDGSHNSMEVSEVQDSCMDMLSPLCII